MLRLLFILLIGGLLLRSFYAYAVTEPLGKNPNFTKIPINPTESVGEVLTIAQDQHGFLWFGGRNGLARYDGYRFHSYFPDPKNPNAIGRGHIADILEDSHAELWIATYGGGVARLNRALDTFRVYRYQNEGSVTNSQRFSQVYEDNNKDLWIVCQEGIALYDRTKDIFKRVDTGVGSILKMLHLHGDEYLLITPQIIYFWNKTTGTTQGISPNTEDNAKNLILDWTRSAIRGTNGLVWLGHRKGLLKLDVTTRSIEIIPLKNRIPNTPGMSIWKVIEDKNGIIWAATDGNGLMYYDPATKTQGYYVNTPSPSSIGSSTIRTVFEDKDGDFWASAFPSGIYHHDKTNNYFSLYSNFIRNRFNTFSNTVWAFQEDEQQNIWLGVDSLGLVYFDRESDSFSQTYDGFNLPEHGFPNSVISLLKDSRGNLWIGSWSQGVTRFNPKTKQYTHFNPNLANSKFPGESIWSMLESKDGHIYFGTMNEGLIRYNYNTDTFTQYIGSDTPNNLTPKSNSGWALLENEDGKIWIGTNIGINIFDPKTQSFTYIEAIPDSPTSLSNNNINWFYKDTKSRIWIGTTGGGLNLYQPKTQTFSQIEKVDGLHENTIQGIIEDDNGLLWITNTNALISYSPETSAMRTFTENNWVQNGNFCHGAIYKTSQGEILLGGANGFNILTPNKVTSNTTKPNVFFTELALLNEKITPSANNKVIIGDITTTPSITLTHNDPMFSLYFTATSFRVYANNLYKYKLDGFDREWHNPSRNNKATYTHMDAGTYTFMVQAANNDGVWSDTTKTIKVIVLPAPWKTWWAYCIYLGVIIYAAAYYAVSQQRKYAQEKQLNSKLRELDKLKSDFMANTSHELRTPINGIIGIAHALQDGDGGTLTEDAQNFVGLILTCGRRLERLINDILDFSQTKESQSKVNFACFDVTPLVNQVASECIKTNTNNKVTLVNHIASTHPPIYGNPERTKRALFNLVANAVKYTEKGTISLTIAPTTNYLEITIKDTGIGIAKEDIPKLYESFTQIADSGQQIKNGTGLGLALTKYFVEAQGGSLHVESTLGVGTEFKMKLKLATAEQLKDNPLTNGESRFHASAQIDLAISSLDAHSTNDDSINTKDIPPYLPTYYPLDYKPGLQYINVLIVDDEPINRTILRGIGRKSGYIIIEATNGTEAIEAINNGLKCDIILLDVMMPKLSGIDTCKLLRKFHTKYDLPIIFLSAKTQQSDIDECLNAEGNEFLPKPINKQQLLRCIERYTLKGQIGSAVNH